MKKKLDQGKGCACGINEVCQCNNQDAPKKSVNINTPYGFKMLKDVKDHQITNAKDYKTELYQMYNLMMPFLKSMLQEPEKEYVVWPNRAEQVQKIIDQANEILNIK